MRLLHARLEEEEAIPGQIYDASASAFHLDRRVPEIVVRGRKPHRVLFDGDLAFSPSFFKMIRRLASAQDDTTFAALAILRDYKVAPTPDAFSYVQRSFGAASTTADYRGFLIDEPGPGAPDRVHIEADLIAFVSDSGRWCVWAERDTPAIIACVDPIDPHWHLDHHEELFDVNEALSSYLPSTFRRPLSGQEQQAFRACLGG